MSLKLDDAGPTVETPIEDLRKSGFSPPDGEADDIAVRKSVQPFQAS